MSTLLRCFLITGLVASCTSRSAAPPPTPSLRIQYGLASWYGRERHGRRTASGEVFDSNQLVEHFVSPCQAKPRVDGKVEADKTAGRTVSDAG
jgi:rare lipoprotein A